ncbi:MAG: tetratricopeptide repeat protein [Planctomycetaceae bacterium]|jgi:tetratricopeptide (TPR) repeat protein
MTEQDPMQNAARDWYRKGTEALQKENFGYAVECFGTAVKMQPDNVVYRQTRHGSLERMYGGNKTGARLSSVRLVSIRGRLKKHRMKKDWAAVDLTAEEGIFLNPWDGQLYADLGEAAVHRKAQEVAEYAWGKAVKSDITNIAYNNALGLVLIECRKYLAARDCFKRICNADPHNGKARAMMTQCDAQSVMDRGGYDTAETTRDVSTQPEAPVNAYEQDRKARRGHQASADAPGESDESDLRHAIRKEPDNLNHYLRLAEHYRDQRQLAQSMELYEQVLEKTPHNTDVLEFKEDVELDILRDKLADAGELFRKHPEKARLKEKAAELRKQLTAREIEILEPRIERHTQDMKMRFDLAERFRKTKQFVKAIPLYQQASADIRLKEDALVWLGECFVRNGKLALGVRQFDRALESLNAADKPEPFKLAHYWHGRIAEKADRRSDAEAHYTEILSVDYAYRDVQERLEQLQGGDDDLAFDDDETED